MHYHCTYSHAAGCQFCQVTILLCSIELSDREWWIWKHAEGIMVLREKDVRWNLMKLDFSSMHSLNCNGLIWTKMNLSTVIISHTTAWLIRYGNDMDSVITFNKWVYHVFARVHFTHLFQCSGQALEDGGGEWRRLLGSLFCLRFLFLFFYFFQINELSHVTIPVMLLPDDFRAFSKLKVDNHLFNK